MSKALVLGAAVLMLSAAGASAQVYVIPDYEYGYATPAADLAAPGYGYAAPTYGAPAPVYAAPPVYTAPGYGYAAPAYRAPATAGTTVVIVTPAPAYAAPAPVYAAPPVTTGYYAAPPIPPAPIPEPIYDYAPGYHRYGWR